MTFFIGEQAGVARRGPNVALSTNAEAMGASARSYWREVDTFIGSSAKTEMESINVGKVAGEKIGIAALNDWYQQNDAGYDHLRPAPATVDDFIAMHGRQGTDIILNLARDAAATDPNNWSGIDVSQEGIDSRVTEQLKAETDADEAAIALSPNPIRSQLLGGLAGGMADPINLATIPFSGGGSFLRILGREALLNAGVEAAQFNTRKKFAERVDQEAPDFLTSVLMGGLTGAALGGVTEGLPRIVRGIMAAREARRLERSPDLSPATQEAAVQAGERALAEGRPVDQAVTKLLLGEPSAARRPLILDESMAVTPEPTALAPDPITESPLAPVEGVQSTTDQIVATAESGIRKAQKKPTDLSTFVIQKGGIWKGDDRGEVAMLEYRRPGFMKNEKFARSSAGDNRGGRTLDDMRQMAEEAGYLPPQSTINDLLDAVRDDVQGRKRYANEAPASRKTYSPDYVPERAWADPDPEARGYLVNDLEARQMAEPETWQQTLASDMDGFIASRGLNLLPRERDEILSVVSTRGGDVEDLVYSAMSREIDEAEQATIRAQRGEAYGRPRSDVPWGEETGMGPVPDSPDGSPALEPQTAAGDAAQSGARAGEFPVERTDIGDQYVIPGSREPAGVDRQRQQAEIEARKIQSKIRRLNQARVEDEVDGLFAQKQVDMFDDLSSPEAQAYMEAEIANMRAMLEDGDIEVSAVADDGRALNSLSDIMDEIDDEAALVREFDLCRLGGGTIE